MVLSTSKSVQFLFLFLSLTWSLIASPTTNDGANNNVDVTGDTAHIDGTDIVVMHLPDGRLRYDFYHLGTLQLYVEEKESDDDSVSTYDAGGNEISLEEYEGNDRLAKRVSKWKFLLKFAKLLAKFGKRALAFFECTGITAAWKCSDDFLDCATYGTPPWLCIEGLACIGTSAYACR